MSDASETGEDGESAENPQLLIPGESSLEDVIDSAGLEARDAVDAMSECFGQQGLIRTSEEQDKEEDVMADASDYGDNADIPLVGRISNNAEEEENKSAFLCDLYYSVKSAEDAYVLKPGANLEYLLKICKFSPEELLDIRQKLQDMSYDEQYMSREPDKSAEYLPGYETAKAECKDLIIKQLYKFFQEAVRREATGFEAGERDMDHSPQDEVTDDEEMSESAWLSKLYDDMQSAENPLEAGERLELAIETCRFSPNELPDIRQRLQNLSSDQPNETGEHNPRAEDRPAHKQAYAECEALIMEQLSRQIQESLQREEAAQAAEQDSVPPKTPANGGHISWASEKTDGAGEDLDNPPESEKRESSDSLGEDVVNSSADENDSVEIARLRNLLNTAQSTENFEPGESLDEMIEGCSFPPKEYFDINRRIHGLFVAKPHSVGDDNELAEYQSSQEIANAEFRELMITQLRRRVVEAVRNRKVTSSAGTVQPVTPSYVGLDISADSPDSPGGSPQATEDLGVVGGARPRGVTLVTRTWAAASTSFSSSYQKPVPQTTGSGLPLIMSLDGPVRHTSFPSTIPESLTSIIGKHLPNAFLRRAKTRRRTRPSLQNGQTWPPQRNLRTQATTQGTKTLLRRSIKDGSRRTPTRTSRTL